MTQAVLTTTGARRAPAAALLILALGTAIFLNYADRGMVGVAGPVIKTEMGLTATSFGVAVSAFFWVYAPAQLLVGWMVDRFRVYRLFAAGVAVWGLATAATSLASGFAPLVALRVLLGIGESFAFPGASKIIARDVPGARRGLANSAVSIGVSLGPAFGTLAGGLILAQYGWRPMFAVFGLGTLVWLLPWWLLTRAAPDAHSTEAHHQVALPAILRQPALWVISGCHFANNYCLYFFLTWLPLYLVKSRGFTIGEMAGIAGATYTVQAIGALLAGVGGDWIVARGVAESRVRRTVMVVGAGGTAMGVLAIVSVGGAQATIPCLLFTGFFMGIGASSLFLISQIFAGPHAAGRWVGVQNAIGNAAGILGPIITGALIDLTGSYTIPFQITAGVAGLGALAWAVLVPRIKPVAWVEGR
jgi:MFS family permease